MKVSEIGNSTAFGKRVISVDTIRRANEKMIKKGVSIRAHAREYIPIGVTTSSGEKISGQISFEKINKAIVKAMERAKPRWDKMRAELFQAIEKNKP